MARGAEALCESYGQAMIAKDGRAIAGHYVFPYVSFTQGRVHSFDDRATADAACAGQVERFDRVGVGTDIRLIDYKVVPVSAGSALCHLTWEVFPVDGTPGWKWTNVYGYRKRGDEEGFEFNISDNEMGELLSRYPDFFTR